VRDLAVQMLSALRAGAAAGLVHCDIKPGNILATSDGRWKLADFGIARSIGLATGDETGGVCSGPEDTVAGTIMGTPAYLSPERLCGQAATEAADVFSLGVVLYEALTGRRPFRTIDAFPWSTALSGRPAEPVRSLRSGVEPALAATVDRAVRLDPSSRFARAEEMATALDAAVGRGGVVRLVGTPRARRVLTGALVGAAALATSLMLLTAGTSAPPAPAGTLGTTATQPAADSTPTPPATTTAPAVTAPPPQVSTPPVSTSRLAAKPAPARLPAARPAPAGAAGPHGKGPGQHHKGPGG
jgi:serine/threonine-protein kinase